MFLNFVVESFERKIAVFIFFLFNKYHSTNEPGRQFLC